MQITYKKIRESTELVDGVFWGFDPVGGFDIDMFIEDNRITELQNAKIIRVNDSPYAAEFNLFNYTYYRSSAGEIGALECDEIVFVRANLACIYCYNKYDFFLQKILCV